MTAQWARPTRCGAAAVALVLVLATVAGAAAAGSTAVTRLVQATTLPSALSIPQTGTRSSACGHSAQPKPAALGRALPYDLAAVPSAAANGGPAATPVSGSYDITLPRQYRSTRPAPLIFLFYGFASNPAQFSSLTNMPRRGAQGGDIVVVPHTQSTGPTAEWQFSGTGTDGQFVQLLLASIERSYCVDPQRVFATGFSAGAAFTIFYACTHQGQIAAIATVAVDFQLGCTKPLPVLAFHGTADPEVPYQNGAVGLSLPGVKVRGTELNMGDWARLDRCRPTPSAHTVGSQVQQQSWRGCTPGTSVTLYTVVGGGHTWPGADPHQGVGLTTEQVNATTQILRFFNAVHRR